MVMHACDDRRWSKPETCVSSVAPCVAACTLSAPQQFVRIGRVSRAPHLT
jgi:hypothetical protein